MLRDIILKFSLSLEAKKIDSAMNDNSVIEKAEQNTIYSVSIVPEKTSISMQEQVRGRKVVTFDSDGVLILPSEFQAKKTIMSQAEENTEGDHNSIVEIENLLGGKNIGSQEEICAHRGKEMNSEIEIKELPDLSTTFKEVQLIGTLPIGQFFILDMRSLLYFLGNDIYVQFSLVIPKSIHIDSKLRDMLYNYVAMRHMKIKVDKIERTNFKAIDNGFDISYCTSASKIEITEPESDSDSAIDVEKNQKISEDIKTDVSNKKECDSKTSGYW